MKVRKSRTGYWNSQSATARWLNMNKEVYTQTMLMARHQKIAKLFDEDFLGDAMTKSGKSGMRF